MGINSLRGRIAQMSEKRLKSCVGQVALTVCSQRQRTGAEAGRMMACLGYAEPLEGQGGLKSTHKKRPEAGNLGLMESAC